MLYCNACVFAIANPVSFSDIVKMLWEGETRGLWLLGGAYGPEET